VSGGEPLPPERWPASAGRTASSSSSRAPSPGSARGNPIWRRGPRRRRRPGGRRAPGHPVLPLDRAPIPHPRQGAGWPTTRARSASNSIGPGEGHPGHVQGVPAPHQGEHARFVRLVGGHGDTPTPRSCCARAALTIPARSPHGELIVVDCRACRRRMSSRSPSQRRAAPRSRSRRIPAVGVDGGPGCPSGPGQLPGPEHSGTSMPARRGRGRPSARGGEGRQADLAHRLGGPGAPRPRRVPASVVSS